MKYILGGIALICITGSLSTPSYAYDTRGGWRSGAPMFRGNGARSYREWQINPYESENYQRYSSFPYTISGINGI